LLFVRTVQGTNLEPFNRNTKPNQTEKGKQMETLQTKNGFLLNLAGYKLQLQFMQLTETLENMEVHNELNIYYNLETYHGIVIENGEDESISIFYGDDHSYVLAYECGDGLGFQIIGESKELPEVALIAHIISKTL
jgi:hypothetical protein